MYFKEPHQRLKKANDFRPDMSISRDRKRAIKVENWQWDREKQSL